MTSVRNNVKKLLTDNKKENTTVKKLYRVRKIDKCKGGVPKGWL